MSKAVRSCYNCGKQGHLQQYCRVGAPSQGSSPGTVNQGARRPPHQLQQAPGQSRGRGGGVGIAGGSQPRVFEMRRPDALNAPTATGTIWIQSKPVHILFDTGATHSFMSTTCVDRLGLTYTYGASFVVGLPDGSTVRGNREIL